MKTFRLFCAAVLVGLAVAGQASAGVITETSPFDDWSANPMKIGDKTFTYIGDSGLFGQDLIVNFIGIDGGTPLNFCDDIYTLQLSNTAALALGDYSLQYSVEIDTALAPDCFFTTAALDVDHIVDNSLATKQVFSDPGFGTSVMAQLNTNNGVPDGPKGISGQLILIYVQDNLTLSAGPLGDGTILSMSNTFTQGDGNSVPEPTTLAMWGGMVGLGFLFSRRRKS